MPPTPSSRAEAYAYGRECAAHLLQWFKDNPAYVSQGLLSRIARDIDFTLTEQSGYWLGFFNHLERLISLSAQRMNVYAYTDHQHRIMDAQVERSLLERRVLKRVSKGGPGENRGLVLWGRFVGQSCHWRSYVERSASVRNVDLRGQASGNDRFHCRRMRTNDLTRCPWGAGLTKQRVSENSQAGSIQYPIGL